MGHPFGQFESAVLAVSPPSFLPTHSLLAGGAEWEGDLDAVQYLLSSTQTHWCVMYTVLVTDAKQSTA